MSINLKPSLGRVLVVGGGFEYIRLFLEMGYSGAKTIDEADMVLFTGGADVSPNLYGEIAMRSTNFDSGRDEREQVIYHQALALGLPMVGICRGGQFLNVMNQGTLWQHVTNHTTPHNVKEALPKQLYKGRKQNAPRVFEVTSTHHQMMIPHKSGVVLLLANEAGEKYSYGRSVSGPPSWTDVEAVWYPSTKCFCFQPHPEFANAPKACVDYFSEMLDELVLPEMPLPNEVLKILETPADKKKKEA